jgi:hypothetical protein
MASEINVRTLSVFGVLNRPNCPRTEAFNAGQSPRETHDNDGPVDGGSACRPPREACGQLSMRIVQMIGIRKQCD